MFLPHSLAPFRAADEGIWSNRNHYGIQQKSATSKSAAQQHNNRSRQIVGPAKFSKVKNHSEQSPDFLLGNRSDDTEEETGMGKSLERTPRNEDGGLTPHLMAIYRKVSDTSDENEEGRLFGGDLSLSTADTSTARSLDDSLKVMKKLLSDRSLRDWSTGGHSQEYILENISEDSDSCSSEESGSRANDCFVGPENDKSKSLASTVDSGEDTIFTSDASTAYISESNETSSAESFSADYWAMKKRRLTYLLNGNENDQTNKDQIYPLTTDNLNVLSCLFDWTARKRQRRKLLYGSDEDADDEFQAHQRISKISPFALTNVDKFSDFDQASRDTGLSTMDGPLTKETSRAAFFPPALLRNMVVPVQSQEGVSVFEESHAAKWIKKLEIPDGNENKTKNTVSVWRRCNSLLGCFDAMSIWEMIFLWLAATSMAVLVLLVLIFVAEL